MSQDGGTVDEKTLAEPQQHGVQMSVSVGGDCYRLPNLEPDRMHLA